MNIAIPLMNELVTMALLICLGAYTKRSGIFTEETAKRLANFLLCIVMPALLIHTFQQEKKPELMPGFWAMMLLSVVMFAVSPAIATFVFRKKGADNRYRIDRIAAVMPNCGFMGIPLLTASIGGDSSLYCVTLISVFQLMTWAWAVPMMEGKRPTIRSVFINPGVISFFAGLAMFVFEIRLPRTLVSFAGHLSAVNTPVSMLMIGIFLSDMQPLKILRETSIYKTIFWKNLGFPLISLFFIYAFGLNDMFGKVFSLSFMIMISCSSAASALLIPLRVGEDSSYASGLISMSTLSSLVTIPFMVFITDKILR